MNLTKKDFLKLKQEWYQKLKDSGFEDIENAKGQLKQYDRRTQLFQDREMVQEFFTYLEHFITAHPEIPELHQKVLTLYVSGAYIKAIAHTLHMHRWTVYQIIKKYKQVFPTFSIPIDV